MALMNGSFSGKGSGARWRYLLRVLVLVPLLLAVAAALPIERAELGLGAGVRTTSAELAAAAERLLEASSLTLHRPGGEVLTLNGGRVWWGAHIVSIGTTIVTVSHDGGLVGVPLENIPALELERAQAAVVAAFKQSQRWEAEEVDREWERTKATLLAAQKALAAAPANVEAPDPAKRLSVGEASASDPTKPGPVQRLSALKKKFPLRAKGRTDRGIEFDVPTTEVWLFYRRTFDATSLETLPETLAFMESRLIPNLDVWHWRAKTTESLPQSPEYLQALRTHAWLDVTLRAFMAEARQLTRVR